LYFEASQEGKVIDLFINLMKIKERDTNYDFINGIKLLNKEIDAKLEELKRYRR
jgi:hypothetical protein